MAETRRKPTGVNLFGALGPTRTENALKLGATPAALPSGEEKCKGSARPAKPAGNIHSSANPTAAPILAPDVEERMAARAAMPRKPEPVGYGVRSQNEAGGAIETGEGGEAGGAGGLSAIAGCSPLAQVRAIAKQHAVVRSKAGYVIG